MHRPCIRAVLLLVLAAAALPQPSEARKTNPRWDPVGSGAAIRALDLGPPGVLNVATTGTTYFGGTVWAPDSGRWEAIKDSCWTFDTGVASAIVGDLGSPYPGADPNKDGSLHAVMEGWVGFDRSFSTIPFFRRLSDTDVRWTGPVCAGGLFLGGGSSFWCGVFPDEADSLCYTAGQGYGNGWRTCIGQTFGYTGGGAVVLFSFLTLVQTEAGNDLVTVEVDTTGAGDIVEVAVYSGWVYGIQNLSLIPGVEMRSSAGPVQIRFCFTSDAAGSDEDGLFPTDCGAFAVDLISMTGGITHSTDFETGADGWALLSEPGRGGEWSNIVHLNDLPPPLTPCVCSLTDSVLVFEDLFSFGHGLYQDNLACSPWIDLERNGILGFSGLAIQFDGYFELPLLNYIFIQTEVKYWPEICPATGALVESEWTNNGFIHYFGSVGRCSTPGGPSYRQVFDGFVPCGAEEIKIALGVINYSRFFGTATGVSNSTPWFDNVKLCVYGDALWPTLNVTTIDQPQDAFPENGTLHINAPGRFDSNTVNSTVGGWSSPEAGTSLGDTLVVHGCGLNANGDGAEVYVQFAVTPGPGISPGGLAAFYSTVTFEEVRYGQSWYSARMDTAEVGGIVTRPLAWMTAFHESAPGFSGTDTDLDGSDLDPNGGITRLANDIFPDDLFTPGTRVNLFFRSRWEGDNLWCVYPDTTGGRYKEYECLPSSMAPDTTWNCVLYVDHGGGGPDVGWRVAQPIIEVGLTSVLGTGSANFESTNWDRFDVNAPSSAQASFGRPLNTEYGATVIQAMAYQCILWNSSEIPAFNLVKEDGDVLIPWLTLVDFDFNSLYLSGNDLAATMTIESASEPSALDLLTDLAGVVLNCSTFHDPGCPSGSLLDITQCVRLDPVGGAPVAGARTVVHRGLGNGCPQRNSFDILTVGTPDYGAAAADERYNNTGTGGKLADFASIASDAGGGVLNYRIVTDGVSVHQRRDGGAACTLNSGRVSVTERIDEVMTFFGHDGSAVCDDRSAGISVNDGPRENRFQTALARFSPNPLMAGATGRISFTLARESHARVDVFDLSGRLVKTLFDGIGKPGKNDVTWTGNDETGRQVASGVYFYRLSTNLEEYSKKMVVIRQGN